MRKLIERRLIKFAEEFFDRCEKTDSCWLWSGPVREDGYATVSIPGCKVPQYVHRIAYKLNDCSGVPLQDWMLVCHKCDVRRCINPDHLFVGTALDNIRDSVAKGRNAFGERNHSSKLKAADIPIIRQMLADGIRHRIIANRFGVTKASISYIACGITWKQVERMSAL